MGFSSRLKAHRHLLTLETLKFIVAFIEIDNAADAALYAGIPKTYASRQSQWLKKLPLVRKAMETEIDERDLRDLKRAIAEIEERMEMCKRILGLAEE